MTCFKIEQKVKNSATELKEAAIEEVRQKGIFKDACLLTRRVNPYALKDIVISDRANVIKIHFCGETVFLWSAGLKRYICGEWSGAIANEAETIRQRQKAANLADAQQVIANEAAVKNFVLCHQ